MATILINIFFMLFIFNIFIIEFFISDMGARFGDDFQRKRQLLYQKGEENIYELMLTSLFSLKYYFFCFKFQIIPSPSS